MFAKMSLSPTPNFMGLKEHNLVFKKESGLKVSKSFMVVLTNDQISQVNSFSNLKL